MRARWYALTKTIPCAYAKYPCPKDITLLILGDNQEFQEWGSNGFNVFLCRRKELKS